MDENLHNHIDKLFHDSIEPLSELPQKHVWENIEQQLDKNNAEKYKRKYIIFKRAAVVLLFLLLSFVTFNLINHNKPEIIVKRNQSIIKKHSPDNINSSSINNAIEGLNHQTKSINSAFLSNKSRRKQFIKQMLIAKIKNGAAEQEVSGNEDIQLTHDITSMEPVPKAITHRNYNTTLIKIPKLQILKTGINDSLTMDVNHLAEKSNKKNNNISPRFSIIAFAAPEF